jgi:NSS family neurotransmitter:Na+ symporter
MTRETFATRFGVLMSMIGVAVGLGNVWRFPYMVGKFGGAAFVLFYLLVVAAIGVPALMAEWVLGRHTRRGPVGAFDRAGAPFGRQLGWLFFCGVTAATAYYVNVIGWVAFHGLAALATPLGASVNAAAILPPERGFAAAAFLLQLACTSTIIAGCAAILLKGLRSGIERASVLIMPLLLAVLLVLIARSVTLPGAAEGLRWYAFKLSLADLKPGVMLAALGQAVFSLALGGTYMVIYGSYLRGNEDLRPSAALTAAGDTTVGLLAGLAIFPAVFALGLEPSSGPGLIFSTLPGVFARLPAGWVFALLFFLGLSAAAYLSAVAAFEVLVAGLTDNTEVSRRRAVWLVSGLVFLLALPPMINMQVFVPWDLTFGSGMQTLGAVFAVVTVGWAMKRAEVLGELAAGSGSRSVLWLFWWIRYVIPGAILAGGVWWFLTRTATSGHRPTRSYRPIRTGSRFWPQSPGGPLNTPAHGVPHLVQRPSSVRCQALITYQSRATTT